ncbi:MAG: hypothetical protein ACR2IE_04155 [Candidatus Sumerlaeaceae bacterium]
MAAEASGVPMMAREYMNVLTTYGCYAKSIWHEAEPGGYWGDGIDAKNQNGAVRGMCNTMLTYVMLARGLDKGWIAAEDRARLDACGLSRDELTSYAKAQLDYLITHHKSRQPAQQPQWGFWWQSPLWLGAVGPAVLLCWDELSTPQRDGITRIAGAEADRIAAMPPKDYVAAQGDTGAEENGWNTAAPALALALAPKDPRGDTWWRALKVYALNTYSHPSDRTSTATVGTDIISELVSTASLLPDWTMFNHGFFHPDYVQVSGQHLGEAWLILALGDRLHVTKRAEEFRPYALHHVRDVWEKIARPLLLPSGEFAFPNGNDWTFHCSTIQSYLAYIATALGDPVAADAEGEGIKHVQRRREVSPPGRLLGDSNLEWWWEPLVCKRASTALLHHELAVDIEKAEPQRHRDTEENTEQKAQTWFYPDAKVWVHRNEKFLVTASWGVKPMATIYALVDGHTTTGMYMTLPVEKGLLPTGLSFGAPIVYHAKPNAKNESSVLQAAPSVAGVLLRGTNNERAALIALPNSVVVLGTNPLGPLGIENDSLTTPGRQLWSDQERARSIPALASQEPVTCWNWINIDDSFSVITRSRLTYKPAGKWTRKSAAIDLIDCSETTAIQLLPSLTAGSTNAYANKLGMDFRDQIKVYDVGLRDVHFTGGFLNRIEDAAHQAPQLTTSEWQYSTYFSDNTDFPGRIN